MLPGSPEVLACYFDAGFSPPLSAMRLRWPGGEGREVRTWLLPRGERLSSPPPDRLGITICRRAEDAYDVFLLWGAARFCWLSLCRDDLRRSSLSPLLHRLGTDLESLLAQPVLREVGVSRRLAG